MTYDSFAQPDEMTHLVGDVPLLFAVAAILVVYHPLRLARRQEDAAPDGSIASGLVSLPLAGV